MAPPELRGAAPAADTGAVQETLTVATKRSEGILPPISDGDRVSVTPPVGWDADQAAERIRTRAQAARLGWARTFAAFHHGDPIGIEAQAAEEIRKADRRILDARERLAAEGGRP